MYRLFESTWNLQLLDLGLDSWSWGTTLNLLCPQCVSGWWSGNGLCRILWLIGPSRFRNDRPGYSYRPLGSIRRNSCLWQEANLELWLVSLRDTVNLLYKIGRSPTDMWRFCKLNPGTSEHSASVGGYPVGGYGILAVNWWRHRMFGIFYMAGWLSSKEDWT